MLTISSEVAEQRLLLRIHVRMPFAEDSTMKASPEEMHSGASFDRCMKFVENSHTKLF